MIDKFQIKNFRGIKDLTLNNLGKINILVGDNATGKSSILDALFISINPNNPDLIVKTNLFRKTNPIVDPDPFWKSFFYKLNYNKNIEINCFNNKEKVRKIIIKPNLESEKQLINLEITNKIYSQTISGIYIDFYINKKKYTSKISPKLSQDSSDISKISYSFNREADPKYNEIYNGYYFNNATFREPLFKTFSDIVKDKKKNELLEFITTFENNINFENNIEDIDLVNEKLFIKDKRFPQAIELQYYGDGIVKGVYIISNILTKNNGLILLDELENGLHWSKQEIVLEAIVKIAKEQNQQIFITTHSKELINNLYNVVIKDKSNDLDLINLYRLEPNKEKGIEVIEFTKQQIKVALEDNYEIR